MQLFFCRDIAGDRYTLSEEESKHAVRVLRLAEGDSIDITDGKGNLFHCRIISANPKRCEVRVDGAPVVSIPPPFRIHIGIAPTKNIERFEWFLEKATEIGVDVITPVFCRYSERAVLKQSRLEKVIVSAMKQSLKTTLPILNEPVNFSEIVKTSGDQEKFIAYCETGEEALLSKLYKPHKDVIILIGPEGDFSPEEIVLARSNGFVPVSLGPSRLRTETAGVVACHTINLLNL
jgi:16S rRNA (uracil1498-N3)-methyltransferase